MKNIHLLPTNKLSRLHLAYDKDYYLSIEPFIQLDTKNYKSFNIYITSDEKIKEGDWCLSKLNEVVRFGKKFTSSLYKKIILTTDQDLIKDGVQAIDDEFLEWWIKNPSCDRIDFVLINDIEPWYKIIIPKEEPKTNLDRLPFPELVKEFAEYYENVPLVEEPKQETIEKDPCNFCGKTLREQMKGCNEITCYRQFLNKQETLEEVAEKYAEHQLTGIDDKFSKFECINDFISGAKWQQEQDKNKYSEEEVRKISLDFFYHWWNSKGTNTEQGFDKWFEQIKKK
jgi:hypothetical protein